MAEKILVALLCVGLCTCIFHLREKIQSVVNWLCGFISRRLTSFSRPLQRLWAPIKEGLLDLFSWGDDLPLAYFSRRYPIFGKPSAIRLFLICFLYLVVTLIICAFSGSLFPFLDALFYSMPMGFLIQWATQGLPFDAVSLLSAGFTGFLILKLFEACMKTDGRRTFSGWRLPIKIFYYLILTATACSLSVHWGFVWDALATFGMNLPHTLSLAIDGAQVTLLSVLAIIGSLICSVLLLYLGLLLTLVSIREYIDIIGNSIVSLLLLLVVYLLMDTFLPQQFLYSKGGDIMIGILVIGIMLYTDYTRVNANPDA